MLGFLNVYKPSGVTSHDVVNRVRRTLSLKHVGHGGTLDPLAEGVLPLAIGSACRLLRFLGHDKIYLAGILFGQKRDTDDIEGAISETFNVVVPPSLEAVQSALKKFEGVIMQRPPLYSAIHQNGKRLYELAREGKTPEIAEREVEVRSIEIISYSYPALVLRIACGGGTYIRSIARDLGDRLQCGGCLQTLVREKSGPFEIHQSIKLDENADKMSLSQQIEEPTRALTENKEFAVLELDEEQTRHLKMGQRVPITDIMQLKNASAIIATCNQEVVAICRLEDDGKLKPEVVVSHAG